MKSYLACILHELVPLWFKLLAGDNALFPGLPVTDHGGHPLILEDALHRLNRTSHVQARVICNLVVKTKVWLIQNIDPIFK